MLRLKKEFFAEMVKQAKLEFPNEACGILAGKEDRIEKIYAMTNAQKSPNIFFMDPKEQFKVSKEMRALGLEMLGIYHSHVASNAYPSSRDVEMAFYPQVSYVILSLKDQDNPSVRSFKIREGKISAEELKIE